MSRDYIHLIGAEDVRSAGNTMSGAADRMASAAASFDDALRQHRNFLDDWLMRFEAAVSQIASNREPT